MSSPFSMDTANQIAQTKGFVGLVEDAQANIKRTQSVAESYQAVHSGEMATSVQTALHDLDLSLNQNNAVLQGIVDALHQTSTIVSNTEADNAGAVAHAASGFQSTGFFGHH